MRLRPASVAGLFYPGDPDALRKMLGSLMPDRPARPAKAILVPHAGYVYSGPVAGATYARVSVPSEVVLLAFNHRGLGARFALWPTGAWELPLGRVPVAENLAERLREAFPELEEDESAFTREHSAEVQIPFLQSRRPDVRIVPIALNAWEGGTTGREDLARFGRALAETLNDQLVVATTDLTHCGLEYAVTPPKGVTPRDFARSQDRMVLDRIATLDVDGFWETLVRAGVSMCGVAPTAAFLDYVRGKGAQTAEVVAYATSADDEPDAERAVGYPGVVAW